MYRWSEQRLRSKKIYLHVTFSHLTEPLLNTPTRKKNAHTGDVFGSVADSGRQPVDVMSTRTECCCSIYSQMCCKSSSSSSSSSLSFSSLCLFPDLKPTMVFAVTSGSMKANTTALYYWLYLLVVENFLA